jgi:hypothetical protein
LEQSLKFLSQDGGELKPTVGLEIFRVGPIDGARDMSRDWVEGLFIPAKSFGRSCVE